MSELASQIQREFAGAAAEVESIAGEAFTFRGRTYRGVINQQPLVVALTVPGMSESAEAMLSATRAQFGSAVPGSEAADNREIIHIRNRDWKVVSFEDDNLHLRFGLRLDVGR